jgi:hypothetical protein
MLRLSCTYPVPYNKHVFTLTEMSGLRSSFTTCLNSEKRNFFNFCLHMWLPCTYRYIRYDSRSCKSTICSYLRWAVISIWRVLYAIRTKYRRSIMLWVYLSREQILYVLTPSKTKTITLSFSIWWCTLQYVCYILINMHHTTKHVRMC